MARVRICPGAPRVLLYIDHLAAPPRPSVVGEGVIGIAVQPAFAGLGRCDQRVSGCVSMLGGVAIWRVVAAQCSAAFLTNAQVNPLATGLHTLFAFVAFRVLDCGDGGNMSADTGGHDFTLVPIYSTSTQST